MCHLMLHRELRCFNASHLELLETKNFKPISPLIGYLYNTTVMIAIVVVILDN